MAQNQVSITVSGRSYTISADADRDTLLTAVERVNESITRYRKMPMSDELRAATLSAVIFAYDLIEHESRSDSMTRETEHSRLEITRLQNELNSVLEKQNDILAESGRVRDLHAVSESERNELRELKAALLAEIETLRSDSETLISENQQISEELAEEKKRCAEAVREKELADAKCESSARESAVLIKNLRDDLDFQALSAEEDLENLRKSCAENSAREREACESAAAVLTAQRDQYLAECEELREQNRISEQENEELRSRETELIRDKNELELRTTELSHFLSSLQEERELLQLERDELLESLTAAAAERDRLRAEIDRVQLENEEIAAFCEKSAAEMGAKLTALMEERKQAESALMKIVGSISAAGIHLS